MLPLVSVIMPAYNSERYIADAIETLQSQAGVDVDIIVIDDGSTDATRDIVGALAEKDPRIRLLTEPHRGVAAARNVGIAAARAELVTFLDSDDLCAPGRLRRQADYLLAHPEIDATIGEVLFFDVAGDDGMPSPTARTMRVTGLHLATVLFRQRVFEKIGVCDESFLYSEDVDLLLRLWESRAALHFDGEIAFYYRWHDTNMSHNQDVSQRFFLRALHRSVVRRRQAGSTEPLPPVFVRRPEAEALFNRD